jgi:Icc-related predicted phosphoesterase
MKILEISDLHVDFGRDPQFIIDNSLFDIAIVAGDIANHSKEVVRYMNKFKEKYIKDKPLLFVAGNHCRWSMNLSDSDKQLSKIDGYLNRKIVEINGQRFLGCTLWYSIKDIENRRIWSDLCWITDWKNLQEEHEKDVQFLTDNLQKGDIVITHMLPSYKCVSYKYMGDPDNRFYVTELEDLIKEREPLLWISGHSHDFMFKKIHNTFYVRNPYGYPKEKADYTTNFVTIDTNSLEYGITAH